VNRTSPPPFPSEHTTSDAPEPGCTFVVIERNVPMERHREHPHASSREASGEHEVFAVGARIEVRDRFRSNWNRGFEIAERTPDGYRIRRTSDRYVLPGEFVPHEVRPTG
jgi:hypothetical protein